VSARPAPTPVFGAQARAQERARRAKVEAKRPKLELVKEREPGRLRIWASSPRAKLFAWFTFAAGLLFALVAFHVVLTQGQFKLQKLETRANQEQAQYERNRLQVAQLESPARITDEAVRLGMVPADKVTPVTPSAGELPRTANGGVAATGSEPFAPDQSIADDPGAWTAVKPHLSPL
jgi:cell division protein FtsL